MDWSAPLSADASWKDRFSSNNVADLTIDGKLIGIPADQSPAFVYYNNESPESGGASMPRPRPGTSSLPTARS
jgi:ABC-type glycerol-3-phosphate transport system substrate-binding protein